jgi:protein-disulfide isomerase
MSEHESKDPTTSETADEPAATTPADPTQPAPSEAPSEASVESSGEALGASEPQGEARAAGRASEPSGAQGTAGEARSSVLGWLTFAVIFVAVLGVGYFAGQQIRRWFTPPPQLEDDQRYAVPLRGDEPQLGPDDALVTIIAFSDFQCPYCAKVVGPLNDIHESYGDDVRIVFKHYPLPGHTKAVPAAHAAWAAHQQDKFWPFHDWVFAEHASLDELPDWLKEHGLDAKKFGADMESTGARNALDDDLRSGNQVGVTGTPAFFVNGHFFGGYRDTAGWEKVVDLELGMARQVERSGVPRAEVYATMMKDAAKERGLPKKAKKRDGMPDPELSYRVPTGEDRPQIGPDDALVTIVEFADFHCPFCARVAPTVKKVQSKYPADVRLVFRQRPLAMHKDARPAAKAAVAAHRQGKFWEMHDRLYESEAKTRAEFVDLATELGLDVPRFEADMDDPSTEEAIVLDESVARRFGAGGTPAFFINGRFISGAQPETAFMSLVDEELAKAKARVEEGTPRAEVYDAVLKDALPALEKSKPKKQQAVLPNKTDPNPGEAQ